MKGFKRSDQKVMARAFERRIAERGIRASILHWLAALFRPQTVAVSLPGLGRGGTEPYTALCNNADPVRDSLIPLSTSSVAVRFWA